MDKIHSIPNLGMDRDSLQEAVQVDDMQEQLTNGTYLQDSSVSIHGLKARTEPLFHFDLEK